LRPVIEYDGALAAVLGLPGRERELFALNDEPATVDRLAAAITGDVWLTVTTQDGDDVARRLEAAGVQPFDERKTLMSIDLRADGQPAATQIELQTDGPLEYVRVLAADGSVAAHGMAAIVGRDAVMHDIQTDPAHRRRGLGSVVMGELGRRAVERGAHTGLLMATTDGFHLYRKLGWLPEATMVTGSGRGRSRAVGGDLGAVLTGR
jgi:GNAT superfamily N-acetyltransferase